MATERTVKARRGMAMLVVLGAVVLFSLLGYAAMTLTGKDALLSGSLVDIKSQRMTACAGLNLGVTRLQRSAGNTVTLLMAFRDDPSRQWIDLGGATPALTATEPDWFPLNASDSSACKLRIVGVSNANLIASTIDVALESIGRGRNGSAYRVQAVYRVHGISFQAGVSTKGPKNAFMAQGGIDQVHVGSTIDGPIYSGNKDGTMIIENASDRISKLRIAGNLRITQSLKVPGNSIINGYLDINSSTSIVTFDSNLVVKGGLKAMDGALTVSKSLYVYKGPFRMGSGANSVLKVGKWLYVPDTVVFMSGSSKMTVGTSGQLDGMAYLAEGIDLRSSATADIHGPMYTGKVPKAYNALTFYWPVYYMDSGYTNIEGNLTVHGDFNYYGDTAGAGLFYVLGSAVLKGRASFVGKPHVVWNYSSIAVEGNALLRKGISSSGAGTITLKDSAWLYNRSGQKNTGPEVNLGKSLSMNGRLDDHFHASSGKWRFSSSGKWSYTDLGLSSGELPDITSIANSAAAPVRRGTDASMPAWVADTTSLSVPSLMSGLGFSASDTDLSVAANPVSVFTFANLSQKVQDSSDWRSIRARYVAGAMKGACDDKPGANEASGFEAFGTGRNYPSAEVLSCIYAHEKALGGSSSVMWNGYLVIHLTENSGDYTWKFQTSSYSGGTLPSGVKILYSIDQTGISNSWAAGNPGWYTGELGSTQIIHSTTNMQGFYWEGTLYGYLLFTYSTGTQMLSGQHQMTLVGAWECVGEVWFTKQANETGSLSIEFTSTTASGIFEDIATSFSTGSDPVLRFNSDGSTDLTAAGSATLQDGWIQFERLGEFR